MGIGKILEGFDSLFAVDVDGEESCCADSYVMVWEFLRPAFDFVEIGGGLVLPISDCWTFAAWVLGVIPRDDGEYPESCLGVLGCGCEKVARWSDGGRHHASPITGSIMIYFKYM